MWVTLGYSCCNNHELYSSSLLSTVNYMVLHWSLIESSGLFSWFGYDIQGKIYTCQLSYGERAWGT